MDQDEQRKLENHLIVMGLNRIGDPGLIPQLARLMRDDDFLMGSLNECDQSKRREMYDALKPHLPFEPKPLDWYLNRIAERAGAAFSRYQPIELGDQKFRQVPQNQATGVIVTLECHTCKAREKFHGPDVVNAVLKARRKGWARNVAEQHEVCPTCPCESRPLARGRVGAYA